MKRFTSENEGSLDQDA